MFEKGELLFCEMLVAGCDFGNADVTEWVFIGTEHVATYSFIDKTAKGLQTERYCVFG